MARECVCLSRPAGTPATTPSDTLGTTRQPRGRRSHCLLACLEASLSSQPVTGAPDRLVQREGEEWKAETDKCQFSPRGGAAVGRLSLTSPVCRVCSATSQDNRPPRPAPPSTDLLRCRLLPCWLTAGRARERQPASLLHPARRHHHHHPPGRPPPPGPPPHHRATFTHNIPPTDIDRSLHAVSARTHASESGPAEVSGGTEVKRFRHAITSLVPGHHILHNSHLLHNTLNTPATPQLSWTVGQTLHHLMAPLCPGHHTSPHGLFRLYISNNNVQC
ncbi:hypothetical protein O3P69_012921 [Scylla paramamosain]|uniref:Uncharacterized protein n=1 Tax=Scylla paramamosain TaxID=85552 RepID=A0AAW0TSK3_SCYPA